MTHVGIYLFAYIDRLSFLTTVVDDLWFQTGLLATILTLALTATSNRWAQCKLKMRWKTLHKATYYIGFLGILHGEIASKQTNDMLYVMLLIYVALLLYRFRNAGMVVVAAIALMIAVPQLLTPTPRTQPDAIVSDDIQYQRCGQYGLDYWESSNGFYNCKKRN